MFGLFRSHRRTSPTAPPFLRRARLNLESLEDRYTPAAPIIGSLSAVHIGSSLVISGQLADESPGNVQVNLGGAVSAQVQARSNGSFEYICAWPGGTQITAQATDTESLISQQKQAMIANPPDANPYLTLSVAYGDEKQITLSGKVIDEAPGGRTVTFNGAATGTTTTDANGNFSITLTATTLGTVGAYTMDPAGHPSNSATVTLTSTAPKITNFYCTEEGDGWFEFHGQVTDEDVQGLVVRFGGALVSLQNQTDQVEGDGWFHFRIQLNGTQSDEGTATAQVTDWWGLTSNIATDDVHQTGV